MKLLSALSKKDLSGKICLLRVDLNIKDDELEKENLRVQAILPTIKFLSKNNAKIVLLSHRGRPKKNISHKPRTASFSLKPFVKIFENLLKTKIEFIDLSTITRDSIRGRIRKSKNRIFLLENLRFQKVEEENNKNFAKQLASIGDVYVNDAFAVSHRQAASVCAITRFLPSYAGLLLEKEIENLDKVLKNPEHPLVVVMGGAKISDKISLIKNFLKKADHFLVGGGIANNFLKAQGLPIGNSIWEKDAVNFAEQISKSKKIILPDDYAVSDRKILDIGPESIKKYSRILKTAKTIIWNGPMGMAENIKFKKGSEGIIKAIGQSKAFAAIGGGETAALFKNKKVSNNVFLSTGGGAMLKYLAGEKLPGITALK